MELIKGLPDTIKSAKLTAEWETALKKVGRGEWSPRKFMEEIAGMVRDMVEDCRKTGAQTTEALSALAKEVIGKCPRCGKSLRRLC